MSKLAMLAAAFVITLVGCDARNEASPGLPSAAPTESHGEDFKFYLVADVPDALVLERLAAAAKKVGVKLTPRTGKNKCRDVVFLDAGKRLRQRSLALRLRHQLDSGCNKRSERLAISFNLTAKTREQASRKRTVMALAKDLDQRNVKARYKLRHVMKQGAAHDNWIVGGTVRRLDRAPAKIADVLAMFPQLVDLESEKNQALTTVGGERLFEKNRDIAVLELGDTEAQVELATIFSANDNMPGKALARELSIELPKCCNEQARAVAEHVRLSFAGSLLEIEQREDLVYR